VAPCSYPRPILMVALLDSAILRNLHLGRTTLYDLCDEDDEALPVIIAELAKHATNNENRVAAREGECELGTLAIGKRCQERIWATGWGVVADSSRNPRQGAATPPPFHVVCAAP
jgi:hypothetical protein